MTKQAERNEPRAPSHQPTRADLLNHLCAIYGDPATYSIEDVDGQYRIVLENRDGDRIGARGETRQQAIETLAAKMGASLDDVAAEASQNYEQDQTPYARPFGGGPVHRAEGVTR